MPVTVAGRGQDLRQRILIIRSERAADHLGVPADQFDQFRADPAPHLTAHAQIGLKRRQMFGQIICFELQRRPAQIQAAIQTARIATDLTQFRFHLGRKIRVILPPERGRPFDQAAQFGLDQLLAGDRVAAHAAQKIEARQFGLHRLIMGTGVPDRVVIPQAIRGLPLLAIPPQQLGRIVGRDIAEGVKHIAMPVEDGGIVRPGRTISIIRQGRTGA